MLDLPAVGASGQRTRLGLRVLYMTLPPCRLAALAIHPITSHHITAPHLTAALRSSNAWAAYRPSSPIASTRQVSPQRPAHGPLPSRLRDRRSHPLLYRPLAFTLPQGICPFLTCYCTYRTHGTYDVQCSWCIEGRYSTVQHISHCSRAPLPTLPSIPVPEPCFEYIRDTYGIWDRHDPRPALGILSPA